MAKLYLKWTVLVWANAIIGLMLGRSGVNMAHDMGIVLGVCAFIPLYALLDNYTLKTGNVNLQKSLLIGVIIRACLQMIMVVDIVAGVLASAIVDGIFGFGAMSLGEYGMEMRGSGFWYGFLMTVVTGGILSALVACLTVFIMLFMNWSDKKEKVI